MDVLTTLFLMIIAGVLIPRISKLLDLVYRNCLLQIRKINEERNHRIQNKTEAENAVIYALNSWDFAENYREVKIEYVQAYAGYYPTVQEETERWEDVRVKCNRAAQALMLINENDRAMRFSQNAKLASKKIEALRNRSHEDTTKNYVAGIDEAKRRRYDKILGNKIDKSFGENWRVFSNQDAKGNNQ